MREKRVVFMMILLAVLTFTACNNKSISAKLSCNIDKIGKEVYNDINYDILPDSVDLTEDKYKHLAIKGEFKSKKNKIYQVDFPRMSEITEEIKKIHEKAMVIEFNCTRTTYKKEGYYKIENNFIINQDLITDEEIEEIIESFTVKVYSSDEDSERFEEELQFGKLSIDYK